MAPARKVYTEAMIRRVLKTHYEVEPDDTQHVACECGYVGTTFEDHFIDQLHKLWHEMFGRTPSTPTTPTDPHTIVETNA